MKSEGKSAEVSPLVKAILKQRGVKTADEQRDFLNPDYTKNKHDPFLLPDMKKAVARIKKALKQRQKVVIYGDYDIDGMTATVILWESLREFGLEVETYTPDRFTEGYGLNITAIEQIANDGAKLIITVDNGTLSVGEIARARELGVDVIVTDHHSPGDALPDAVAVLNPKRANSKYPFSDLAGCGVAFKLVQALQIESQENAAKFAKNPKNYLIPFDNGQEKWLLDLVALGTVCDIVSLRDENRANVKWGLEVLKKTRRIGLRALLAQAGVELSNVSAETLGFVIGPRLNAAGRLGTADMALELLKTDDNFRALELAEKLNDLNIERRKIQEEIFIQAVAQVKIDEPVAIAVGDDWHEGVIGIVASKVLEKFEKPTFIMSRGSEFSKASGRSFGEFSMAKVIHHTANLIEKGGGHLAAGGLTIETSRIEEWRVEVQKFHESLNLKNQSEFLYPEPDVELTDFSSLTPELVDEIAQLEPFGNKNPRPVFAFQPVLILDRRTLGKENNHVKYTFVDGDGRKFSAIAFGAADKFTTKPFDENGEPARARILVELTKNEWNGRVSVEGRLLKMENITDIIGTL